MTDQPSLLSLAYYLPQFHEIPENDEWWGEHFTEWTQVEPAKPFFPWHRIRKPVAPLGYYNLLAPGTMEAQFRLAESFKIDGFAIWHYWFGGGRRLLHEPIAMISAEKLRVRYCIAWANHSWYNNDTLRLLCEQTYPGHEDHVAYYRDCEPHFRSDNYVKVEGRPVFVIYKPKLVPDLGAMMDTWNALARQSGFPGVFFVGDNLPPDDPMAATLDAHAASAGFWKVSKTLPLNFVREKLRTKLRLKLRTPDVYDYWRMVKGSIPRNADDRFAPTVLTGWDTSPRHATKGKILRNFNPATFRRHLDEVADYIVRRGATDNLVLVKSWNEWAEGNLLEPDDLFGAALLEEYRAFVDRTLQGLRTGQPSRRAARGSPVADPAEA
jgi:hypothetical protein